jgi:hypothetical protein
MTRRPVKGGAGTGAGHYREQESEQKFKQVRSEAETAAGTNSAQETTQGQEQ